MIVGEIPPAFELADDDKYVVATLEALVVTLDEVLEVEDAEAACALETIDRGDGLAMI